MSAQTYAKRIAAIRVADAINKIEGVTISDNAYELSDNGHKEKSRDNK